MFIIAVGITVGGSYGIRLYVAASGNAEDPVQELSREESLQADSSSEESQTEVSQPKEESVEESRTEESSAEQNPSIPLYPYWVEGTDPSLWIADTSLYINDEERSEYYTRNPITMKTDVYSELEGIFTFRGNNFRNTASYGTIQAVERKFDLEQSWNYGIGTIETPEKFYLQWREDPKR